MCIKSQSYRIGKLISLLSIVWILTSAVGALADSPMERKNHEASQAFDQELNNNILKKIPSSARILVRTCQLDIVGSPSGEPMEIFLQRTKSAHESMRKMCQDNVEKAFSKLGLTLVDRSILNEADEEIGLSQKGFVDPTASAQFGKMSGATHIVTTKWIVSYVPNSFTLSMIVKVTDLEKAVVVGIANGEQTFPLEAQQPAQVVCNLTGRYNTTYGPMQLQQTGNEIAGSYQYGNVGGNIHGNVNGGVVEWEWIQSNGDKGFGRWDILVGCVGLNGNWGRWTYDTNTMSPTYMKAVPAWQGKWDAQKFAQ